MYDPDTYGNGHYVKIVPDQKEYGSFYYDLRYDKTFNRNNKTMIILKIMGIESEDNNG